MSEEAKAPHRLPLIGARTAQKEGRSRAARPSFLPSMALSGSPAQRDHVGLLVAICASPKRGQLRRRVGIGGVVQVAFGGGDVTVAHHPLDLVDLEGADRLRFERVPQVVLVPMSAQARLCRCLCYADVG
jgi:hypothetical protein